MATHTFGNNMSADRAYIRDDLIDSMDPAYVNAFNNHMSLGKENTIEGIATLGASTIIKIKKEIQKRIDKTEHPRLYDFIVSLLTKASFTSDMLELLKTANVNAFTILVETLHECVENGIFTEDQMGTVQNFQLFLLNCIEDIHMVNLLEKDEMSI